MAITCMDVVDFFFNRALKNDCVEKWDSFLLPQHFCHSKFLTERCTASETLKP
jgi:hypothetical protein